MSGGLRIGTRGSALARAQAEAVARALPAPSELVVITTAGDRRSASGTAPGDGAVGVFVSELETALLRGEVDLCVHSAKDVPPEIADGLCLAAYPGRGDPRDAVAGRALPDLPAGAVVGTGSPRRALQLRALRPDLRIAPLAGNVDSRLARVARGEFDAAILAAAGLERLGRAAEARQVLRPEEMVPAAAQGALVLEARVGDARALAAARAVHDPWTGFCVGVERAVLAALGGGCAVAAGVLCQAGAGACTVLAAVDAGGGRVARVRVGADGVAEPQDAAAREGLVARVLRALAAEGVPVEPARPGR